MNVDRYKLPEDSTKETCPSGKCSHCGSEYGFIERVGQQDKVSCLVCKRYLYFASRRELGNSTESVSTNRLSIKPSQRHRIVERANGRCERCGKHARDCPRGLDLGHVVTPQAGAEFGLSPAEITSDENLILECAECNNGHNTTMPLPLRIYVAILTRRLKEQEKAAKG